MTATAQTHILCVCACAIRGVACFLKQWFQTWTLGKENKTNPYKHFLRIDQKEKSQLNVGGSVFLFQEG